MINNDILRRVRYALALSNQKMVEIFALGRLDVEPHVLMALLAREEEPGFTEATDLQLDHFLNGLIIERRGPPADGRPPVAASKRLSNNGILKKLRIAMELKEEDMLDVLARGGMELSASELGALFRKPDHRHYKPAGGQLLRAFLKGLTLRLRGEAEQGAGPP